jgi:crossover junction endodeoxyribonuclease RusA
MSRFTLPYPPSANRYWRVWRGRAVKSDEARAYQLQVQVLVPRAPLTGPVRVGVSAFRPRKSGDLDNLLKVALDALKGRAFVDDKQVVEIHACLFDDKANPRLEVGVTAMEADR